MAFTLAMWPFVSPTPWVSKEPPSTWPVDRTWRSWCLVPETGKHIGGVCGGGCQCPLVTLTSGLETRQKYQAWESTPPRGKQGSGFRSCLVVSL